MGEDIINEFIKTKTILAFLILLVVNLIIKLNQSFFNKGKLETNRKLVFYHYIKNFLINDLINIIPILLLFG